MEAKRNVHRVLAEKPEGKIPLGRARRRLIDNIKMDLREIVCGGMDCINPAQDRDKWKAVVRTVINLRIP
jgi:hypothetical protein